LRVIQGDSREGRQARKGGGNTKQQKNFKIQTSEGLAPEGVRFQGLPPG